MNDLEAEEEAVGEALLKRTVSFKLHGIAVRLLWFYI